MTLACGTSFHINPAICLIKRLFYPHSILNFDLVTALQNTHRHLYKRTVTSLHQIWAILEILVLKGYFWYFGHLIGLQFEQH